MSDTLTRPPTHWPKPEETLILRVVLHRGESFELDSSFWTPLRGASLRQESVENEDGTVTILIWRSDP